MFDFLKKAITNTYEKIKETLGGNTQELDLKAIEQTLIQQNFTSELTTLLLKKIEILEDQNIFMKEKIEFLREKADKEGFEFVGFVFINDQWKYFPKPSRKIFEKSAK
jgi:hypothetical protein